MKGGGRPRIIHKSGVKPRKRAVNKQQTCVTASGKHCKHCSLLSLVTESVATFAG